jgi:hypothetical protein
MAHLRLVEDKDADKERLVYLRCKFMLSEEVWMDQHDCELIGDFVTRLNYGERISSETNEIRYSEAWL